MTFVDLCLLVDELVVEAVNGHPHTHARADSAADGDIQLRAELDGGRVHVTVAEGQGAYKLPSRRPEPGDPGFALHLVQRLSDRWGMRRDRERATVWLELADRAARTA